MTTIQHQKKVMITKEVMMAMMVTITITVIMTMIVMMNTDLQKTEEKSASSVFITSTQNISEKYNQSGQLYR